MSFSIGNTEVIEDDRIDTYSPWSYSHLCVYDDIQMKNKEVALLRFGANIRSLREKKGFSQEELAFDAGLDRTYVGGVERGERNPTILTSLKIAKALEVELADLVKEVSCA